MMSTSQAERSRDHGNGLLTCMRQSYRLIGRNAPPQDRGALFQQEMCMKRIDPRAVGALALVTALAGCVAPPPGPTIPVAPGPGKPFDAFAADQNVCEQYAASQVAPEVAAANNQAVGTALLTTALGAGLGAAVGGGGWRGNAGRGAGIGAASGAAFGTVVGAAGSSYAQMSVQQRYDVLYGECMMAHGNQVPGFAPPPGAPPYAGAGSGPQSGPPPGYGPPSGYGSPPGYGPPPGY
jgi:hypothetical protein